MRIIAGTHRGRRILPPVNDSTRPITDRVKQSLFDVLCPRIEGAGVLDLFAGTGSMGLESLSRGAARAVFFESDRSAARLLRQNIAALKLAALSTVVCADLFRWFCDFDGGQDLGADIVFLDPPYRFLGERPEDLRQLAIQLAQRHLAPDGIVIFRHDRDDLLELPALRRYDQRVYGSMTLDFFDRFRCQLTTMPVPRYRYFTPSDAARVSRLQITARQVVEGVITGLHKSPHRGFSVEFSEHREYVPGDELRHLDWKAYARSDRYYIKLSEQETNLRATLVLDTSASMKFGNKLDYARHLAACLAYLLSMQQDLAGLVAVDDSIRVELPPGSSAAHLDLLFRHLETLEAARVTDLPRQLHSLSERLPRRSLVILLSDLWLEPDELVRALQHLRYRKHQAIVLHLLDRKEIDLPYDRKVTFEDLETGEKLQADPADLRETYQKQIEEYLAAVRRSCNDADVEYQQMFVDEPYDKALLKLLGRRR